MRIIAICLLLLGCAAEAETVHTTAFLAAEDTTAEHSTKKIVKVKMICIEEYKWVVAVTANGVSIEQFRDESNFPIRCVVR